MVDTIFPTPGTYTSRQGRQTQVTAFAGATAARPFGAITGVRPGTSVTTVTATTTLVTVQPFACVADPQVSNLASAYEIALDGVYTVALVAQSASVPRSDIVWVQANDNQEDGSGALNSSSAVRGYTAGTTVAIPAAPVRAFIIAVINVPIAGSAPTVTWVAPYAVAAGGILPAASSAVYPAAATYPGQYLDDLSTGLLLRSNGTAWVTVAGSAVGTAALGSGITVPTGYVTKLEKNGNIVTCAFAFTNVAGTPTAALGSGSIIATLPAGFRPQGNNVIGFLGYNNSGLVSIAYTIEPNGNLRAQPNVALGAGAILYGTASFSVA